MSAFLPIAVMPGLASAAPAPADPALSAYRAVMARRDAVERGGKEQWHLVEEWCEAEADALDALVERWCKDELAALDGLARPRPVSLPALLNRLVVLAERLDDGAGWNMMDEEAELLRALGEQARTILAGAGGTA